MLNIGRLAAGGQEYYLSTVCAGVEEYYLGAGEAPGYWTGRGAADLGLRGRVDAEALRSVLGGTLPDGTTARAQRRTAGFDVTLRAPKSVALLWALGAPAVSAQVRAAHDTAVAAAVDYLERTAAATRRGTDGVESVAAAGFVAAAFRHRTSRAGDPLIHTHVLVANAVRTGDDGVWRTLDGRLLYRHAKTAGYVYQCQLRYELTRALGVGWSPVRNGYAEIEGIPRPLIDAFSQRRRDIVAELDRRGATSAKAAQVATLTTRSAKDPAASAATLAQHWAERSADLGFPTERISGVVGRTQWQPLEAPEAEAAAALLAGPLGLTQRRSSFTRADVVRGWCEQLPAGAPLPQVLALADAFLAGRTGVAIPLHPEPPPDPLGASQARWSTPELLAIEARLVEWATGRTNSGVGVGAPDHLGEALARRPTLSDEQRVMVTALCGDGDGVAVVRGKAGAGKTYALDAARDAWTASGYRVIGAALAARAAAELTAGAGIDAYTVAGLLRDLDGGHPLPARTVLVLDESAMLGTRDLARLCAHAAAADAKVVLVGDDRQLASIDAGGAFTALARRLPVIELTDNRRQAAAWERDALDLLRGGHADRAIAAYAANDRVTVADTADHARAALITDWNSARQANGGTPDGLILAARRVDVADLNTRARACLVSDGTVNGPAVTADGRTFQTGDIVVALRNNRRLGLTNGTRGTISTVDADRRTVTITTHDGCEILVPAGYLDAGRLDHGYAITCHKAQGATTTRAFVLGSDTATREWGYVALSRARDTTRLYVVATPDTPYDDATHPTGTPRPDPLAELVDALRRSDAQTLALDTATASAPLDDLKARHVALGRQLRDHLGYVDPDKLADLRAHRDDLTTHGQPVPDRLDWLIDKLEAAQQRVEALAADPRLRDYAALTDALDSTRVHTRTAARTTADDYADLLGPLPDNPSGRQRWTDAATALDTYSSVWHLHGGAALTARPASPEQAADLARVHNALDRLPDATVRDVDRGLGR